MRFDDLFHFTERDMRMSHIYQPVMLRVLLDGDGLVRREDIAGALLNQDRSQFEDYSGITTNMVGRVLTNRGVVTRHGSNYILLGYVKLTREQVQQLKDACDREPAEYVARRRDAIWEHRQRSVGYISGTLRYEVLKSAKLRCKLCGGLGGRIRNNRTATGFAPAPDYLSCLHTQ